MGALAFAGGVAEERPLGQCEVEDVGYPDVDFGPLEDEEASWGEDPEGLLEASLEVVLSGGGEAAVLGGEPGAWSGPEDVGRVEDGKLEGGLGEG